MTTFWLKVIAMATMVIDHAAIAFFGNALWLRVIGRLAFLIYAFLMAEGFRHYRDDPGRIRKHFFRLTLVMIVSEFACDYFDAMRWVVWSEQSVIPTLWLGFIGMWFTEYVRKENAAGANGTGTVRRDASGGGEAGLSGPKMTARNRLLVAIGWAILAGVSYAINSQYRIAGVLLILAFYLYRDRTSLSGRAETSDEQETEAPESDSRFGTGTRLVHYLLILAAFVVLHVGIEIYPYPLVHYFMRSASIGPLTFGMLFTAVPLALYNGARGFKNRLTSLLYGWFYPLQFFIIILIRAFL